MERRVKENINYQSSREMLIRYGLLDLINCAEETSNLNVPFSDRSEFIQKWIDLAVCKILQQNEHSLTDLQKWLNVVLGNTQNDWVTRINLYIYHDC